MRNRILLLIVFASCLMLCNDTMIGQQGVLAPKKQTPIANNEKLNPDDGKEACCAEGHVCDETCKQGNAVQQPLIIRPPQIYAPGYQNGNEQITPRRYSHPGFRDIIGQSDNVGGTFGAGESSAVTNTSVVWPTPRTTSTLENQSILIGSNYAKNAVVGIYDNDGLASGSLTNVKMLDSGNGHTNSLTNTLQGNCDGAVQVLVNTVKYDKQYDATILKGSSPLSTYDYIKSTYTGTGNPSNGLVYPGSAGSGSYVGSFMYPYSKIDPITGETYFVVINHNHIASIGWGDDDLFTFTSKSADSLYTSSRDIIGGFDDGKSLLHVISGDQSTNDPYYAKLSDPDIKYVRPTAVLLSGDNTLNEVAIGEIEWYAAYMHGMPDGLPIHIGPFIAFYNINGGCGHYSGWACYDRQDVKFDTIATAGKNKFVDGAVRLLDRSRVCVDGSVVAQLNSNIKFDLGVPDDEITSAVLVVPGLDDPQGRRSNFSLKIGGHADMLHTQDSGSYLINEPLIDNYLYSDDDPATSGGPGPAFPRQLSDGIWLGSGQNPIMLNAEVSGLKNEDYFVHPRGFEIIDTDISKQDTEWRPYASTNASVYGVRGDYNGHNDIHTRSIAATDPTVIAAGLEADYDTTSIIEIGPFTANQSYFNIYSMGMLKNFRSDCSNLCDSMTIGVPNNAYGKGAVGVVEAPYFEFTEYNKPIFILNDGDGNPNTFCAAAGINFMDAGAVSINNAIANAAGGGDLHVQAHSFVSFYNEQPLNFDVTAFDNNITILSDSNYIYVKGGLTFINQDTANFTMWARGASDGIRGSVNMNVANGGSGSGGIQIDGPVSMETRDKGLILFRSEYDDVLFKDKFSFLSDLSLQESGELMIQAGHDIHIEGKADIIHGGPRSLLLEAHKTIRLNDFSVYMGFNGSGAGTPGAGYMDNGDLILKAGYPFFHDNSEVGHPLDWSSPNYCYEPGYDNRLTDDLNNSTPIHSGGDIWFAGDVSITVVPDDADNTNVIIRAYNSVYQDGLFDLKFESQVNSTPIHDSILVFAETGNYEAMSIVNNPDLVKYSIAENDYIYFLLQAGNKLGEPCLPTACIPQPSNLLDEWHGNILFGVDKAFTIEHEGKGPTLISAARDIENQVGAKFTFKYKNTSLDIDDDMLITAGRHIETHAPYLFDYSAAGNTAGNNITMQAGRYDELFDCSAWLCKVPEIPSKISFAWNGYTTKTPGTEYTPPNQHDKYNEFSEGGEGHGSILLFSSATFDYVGTGDIKMTALNGNIESDPYLHGLYGTQAPIIFNHQNSPGKVTMEAIDIKLHDVLEYNTTDPANNIDNGNFLMHAFDTILTRNLKYENLLDKGNAEIITDKWKRNANCDNNIHQGHIVLGYAADCGYTNVNDMILFDFDGNPNTDGANLLIKAGYLGFDNNRVTGRGGTAARFLNHPNDRGKAYGGNITFDFLKINMGLGNGTTGGYAEISTPNGNIWGKDSIQFHGINGNLIIDAGLGSLEDTLYAVRWGSRFPNSAEDMLNTSVPLYCGDELEWRTGNIMIKGGTVDFTDNITGGAQPGHGNAIFRTREGYIDIYDRFNATNMSGHLLFYAGTNYPNSIPNQWGDVSFRDFQYTPVVNSGSVFIGADDNIMLNYGYNNGYEMAYMWGTVRNIYDGWDAGIMHHGNPFYTNGYGNPTLCWASFDVNVNGYLWYRHHGNEMFRGCHSKNPNIQSDSCSPNTGECETIDNGARPLTFDFSKSASGGVAVVANNYIDVFTKFKYDGGEGSGLHKVPGMTTLHGEFVEGYGLYMKSTFDGVTPAEQRRNTCADCGETDPLKMDWPAITFHDDARITPEKQKAVIEAPVVEFFGHADLDVEYNSGSHTSLTLKSDSLIFHDSIVWDGKNLWFNIFTEDPELRQKNAMRLGVVNDLDGIHYREEGPAIFMPDRHMPVLEIGYQRCTEPPYAPNLAPNRLSESKGEPTPRVGGHIIAGFKNDLAMPIFNTIVANHARISFIHDYYDNVRGKPWGHAYFRTDLLRIRNKVEFYTDPDNKLGINGNFKMSSSQQISTLTESGMYPRHVHLEPGSELSIPGEDSLYIVQSTTIGGYGEVHENVHVQAFGTIAPGYASLMECDCLSGCSQGTMTIHNLYMEKDAVMRISIGNNHCDINPETGRYDLNCTRTDTLIVQDSIFLWGKITLQVLQETESDHIQPGCHLFMIYNEKETSPEYLHNLHLERPTIDGYNYYIDYLSEPGRVYLCITKQYDMFVQRYVNIHAIEGVTTNPVAEILHYVKGHEDYVFTATYNDKTADPYEVFGIGYYSQNTVVFQPKYLSQGTYEYTIRMVTEPWDVYFNAEKRVSVGNENLTGQRVWAYRNTLFVNVDKADIVSIYNMTGVLFQKLEIPAGLNKLTLDKGVYMVSLKNGVVYKIIIN